jgi:DNA-binding HxlR family transcriptional regulator
VSPTVLNQRLAELREAGIVAHEDGSGYGLEAEGVALLEALAPLHAWAAHWGRRRS